MEGAFTDTQRQPFTAQDIRFTRKRDSVYAIVLAWPTESLLIRSLSSDSPLQADQVATIHFRTSQSVCHFSTDERIFCTVANLRSSILYLLSSSLTRGPYLAPDLRLSGGIRARVRGASDRTRWSYNRMSGQDSIVGPKRLWCRQLVKNQLTGRYIGCIIAKRLSTQKAFHIVSHPLTTAQML